MKFQALFRDWKDVEEHKPGDIIFSAGDKAEVLYFLLSGEVELKLHGETLETEAAGGVFGEMAMMKSAVHNTMATAISDVKLARVNRKNLKQIIKGNNGFSFHMMCILAKRLKVVDEFITDQKKTNNRPEI